MLSKLSALSTKIKILILVLYTALVGVVTILILNSTTKSKVLDGYCEQSYDEYVKLTVRVYEERKSTLENESDFESTTYKVRGFVEKQDAAKGYEIKNIKPFIAGVNRKGKIKFDESSSTYSISKSSTYSQLSSSSFISSSIFKQSVTVDSSSKEETIVDNIPLKLYVNIKYTIVIDDEEINKELKTEIKVTDYESEDFSKYENGLLGNDDYIVNESEAVDVNIEYTKATEESKKDSIKKDSFNFETELNQTYLGDKKIENFSVEIFGKINTKDCDHKIFSEYVRFYTCAGSALNKTASTDTILSSYKIDELYDVETLFVKTVVKFDDGTSSIRKIKIDLNAK